MPVLTTVALSAVTAQSKFSKLAVTNSMLTVRQCWFGAKNARRVYYLGGGSGLAPRRGVMSRAVNLQAFRC